MREGVELESNPREAYSSELKYHVQGMLTEWILNLPEVCIPDLEEWRSKRVTTRRWRVISDPLSDTHGFKHVSAVIRITTTREVVTHYLAASWRSTAIHTYFLQPDICFSLDAFMKAGYVLSMSRGKPDETGMCRAGNRHADGELPEHSA
jgi:hypothetical protein